MELVLPCAALCHAEKDDATPEYVSVNIRCKGLDRMTLLGRTDPFVRIYVSRFGVSLLLSCGPRDLALVLPFSAFRHLCLLALLIHGRGRCCAVLASEDLGAGEWMRLPRFGLSFF